MISCSAGRVITLSDIDADGGKGYADSANGEHWAQVGRLRLAVEARKREAIFIVFLSLLPFFLAFPFYTIFVLNLKGESV